MQHTHRMWHNVNKLKISNGYPLIVRLSKNFLLTFFCFFVIRFLHRFSPPLSFYFYFMLVLLLLSIQCAAAVVVPICLCALLFFICFRRVTTGLEKSIYTDMNDRLINIYTRTSRPCQLSILSRLPPDESNKKKRRRIESSRREEKGFWIVRLINKNCTKELWKHFIVCCCCRLTPKSLLPMSLFLLFCINVSVLLCNGSKGLNGWQKHEWQNVYMMCACISGLNINTHTHTSSHSVGRSAHLRCILCSS